MDDERLPSRDLTEGVKRAPNRAMLHAMDLDDEDLQRPMIGHVAPEAFAGGPIAALEDGDRITIDVPERTLAVDLTDDEIESRLDEWERPTPEYGRGVLAKYPSMFASAAEGAVTRPCPGWRE